MKNFLFSMLIVTFMVNLTFAQNTSWTVDKSHSNVGFTVSHLVISEVDGAFTDYEITAETNSKGELVSVNAVIKTNSVNTNNNDRDNHLRGDDFFNSEKYPEMRFASKKVTKSGKNNYKVSGDLTIRDVTKTVTLDVKFNGTQTDPWGNLKSGWSAKTSIDRFDYNLKWNKALEAGGLVVGKKVDINLKIQLVAAK